MSDSGWSTRELILCALIALVVGVGGTAAWYKRSENANEQDKPVAPEPNDRHSKPVAPQPPPAEQTTQQVLMPEPSKPPEFPTPEQPSLEAFAASAVKAKKDLAHLSCRWLAHAIEEYTRSPKNPGTTEEEKLPTSFVDLLKPPFGGTGFLSDEGAFLDPWNKPFLFELRARKDGTRYFLISTTAPDKTLITQFGIGEHAQPK